MSEAEQPPPPDEEYVQPYTPPTKPPPSRWGFRGTVYFYDHGGEPTEAIWIAYNYACELDELPWKSSKKLVATEEWGPLPVGWPDDLDFKAGLLVVTNNEGRPGPGGIPSDAHRADVAARVVELGVWTSDMDITPFAELAPGRAVPFSPVNDERYLMRCRSGVASVSVTALPR